MKVPCLSITRDWNSLIGGGVITKLGSVNFTAMTFGDVPICFWFCPVFRDLSKTTGRNPQQSKLFSWPDPTTCVLTFVCFALSQSLDIFANGQDCFAMDLALSVSQQNKNTKPLNQSAINPAMVLCVIFLTLRSIIGSIRLHKKSTPFDENSKQNPM